MGVGSVNDERKRAVFLDRDGVINNVILLNGVPSPPEGVARVRITPGAGVSLKRLRERGFELVVVTNQPDIARGATSVESVEAINNYLRDSLPIDAFFVCPHDDGCECRKPQPGLLLRAARSRGVDLASSWMIGDRWKDIEAAHNARVRSILIDRGYPEYFAGRPPTRRVTSLARAVDYIIATEREVRK